VVYKNQKYLKTKLHPKNTAFLIYLCIKAMAPNKSINLDGVYANLWPHSKNPSRNLSHLLVRIKKALKIPSHLLEVSRRRGESVLINRGIHFITDYSEFEQTLATAHALKQAGEWGFAKKEYLHAFSLFRGEPFRKMYDPWSEQMRGVILNKLETEATHFAGSCLERGNKRDAKKVLKKVSKIIPHSKDIQVMLENDL